MMKKEQRQPYIDLIHMFYNGYGLCNFCKFADWIDNGGSCCEADLDCTHPVIKKENYGLPEPIEVWQGADCWCFLPKESLQQIGVAVSITYDGYNAHKSKSKGEYIAIKPSKKDIAEGFTKSIV
jgi:hypothetical protein